MLFRYDENTLNLGITPPPKKLLLRFNKATKIMHRLISGEEQCSLIVVPEKEQQYVAHHQNSTAKKIMETTAKY